MPFFGRMQLAAIEPRDVKRLAAELAEKGLKPGSVRNLLAPVRALLATVFKEGLIRSNPAAGLRITHRVEGDEGEWQRKALSEDDLRAFLGEVPDEWRLFFPFLSHTGLRIGKAVSLSWTDTDFGRRRVNVRGRLYRDRLDARSPSMAQSRAALRRTFASSLANSRDEARRGCRRRFTLGRVSRSLERRSSRAQASR